MEALAAAEGEAARRAAAGAAMREHAAREARATAVNSRKLNAEWLQRMRAAKLEELHAEAGALSREHDAQVDRYDRMIEVGARLEVVPLGEDDTVTARLWQPCQTRRQQCRCGVSTLQGGVCVHRLPWALVGAHGLGASRSSLLCCKPAPACPPLPWLTRRPCWRTWGCRTRSTMWPLPRMPRCWTSCWPCTGSGWAPCMRASRATCARCRRSTRGAAVMLCSLSLPAGVV